MGIYHNLFWFTFDKHTVQAVSMIIEEVKYASGVTSNDLFIIK